MPGAREHVAIDLLRSRGDEWTPIERIARAVWGWADGDTVKASYKLISGIARMMPGYIEARRGEGYRLADRTPISLVPLKERVYVGTSGGGKVIHVVLTDDGRIMASVDVEYAAICGRPVLGFSCRRSVEPERRCCRRCRDELARIAR